MKKYQQLLIISLGLVSFICFLIYKHEYDRLRNVLEVLEIFGSPPPQIAAHRSHPLDLNENPALLAGSINELNLGQVGGNHNYEGSKNRRDQQDDAFLPKNGHGVKPPEDDIPGGGDDLKPEVRKNDNVIQNPIQNSGEVMDNMIDDGGGDGGNGVIGKIGAVKARKAVQRQDSIFKEQQKWSNDV